MQLGMIGRENGEYVVKSVAEVKAVDATELAKVVSYQTISDEVVSLFTKANDGTYQFFPLIPIRNPTPLQRMEWVSSILG